MPLQLHVLYTISGRGVTYLPNLGSKFSRTKTFVLKTVILLAFGLGMCEGVGEDSGHGIRHVDIRVGSCNCLDVIVCHDMCT